MILGPFSCCGNKTADSETITVCQNFLNTGKIGESLASPVTHFNYEKIIERLV